VVYTPRIAAFMCEQFRTSHIGDLPAIEPYCRILLSIYLFQRRPNRVHLRKPILAGSRIMLTRNPPLLLQDEAALEGMQRSAEGIVPCVKKCVLIYQSSKSYRDHLYAKMWMKSFPCGISAFATCLRYKRAASLNSRTP
jgi:hypothetical protein